MIVAVLNGDRAALSTYVRRLDSVPFSELRRLYELSVPPSFRGTEVHAVSKGIAKRTKSRLPHGDTNVPLRCEGWLLVKRCLHRAGVVAFVDAVSPLPSHSPINVRRSCPRDQSGSKATFLLPVLPHSQIATGSRSEIGTREYWLDLPCPAALRSAH